VGSSRQPCDLARLRARLGDVRARTGRDLRRASLPIFCPGQVASLALDLLAETRRDRRAALEEGISDRLAGASCRTGHRLRRPRRCSCCGGRCVLWWGHGAPTDLARGLLSNPVMSSPVSALGDQPLVGQVAPPNSHRPLAVSGSIFEPCRFVALLVDSARACGRRPGPLWNTAGRGRLLAGERRLTPVRGALYGPSPTLARRQRY
jgi:hypothetical protein